MLAPTKFKERMKMKKINILPIDVPQGTHAFQVLVSAGIIFQSVLKESAKRVLEIMKKENLLTEDIKVVFCEFKKSEPFLAEFSMRMGTDCDNDECLHSCRKNLARLIKNEHEITGYESRNPDKKQSGGSVKIMFNLVFQNDESFLISISGASFGLKEWENLALLLGAIYHAKLLIFEDQQVEEIIRRAELAVKNDPWARPRGKEISQYIKKIFDAIDGKLAKAA